MGQAPTTQSAHRQNLLRTLEQEGILRETTGHKRNRRYAYTEYIELFTRQTVNDGGAEKRPGEAVEEESQH